MRGDRPERHAAGADADKPGWLPFGCLVALGEAIFLVVAVLHVGTGPRSAGDSLVASVSHARSEESARVPTTTTSTTAVTIPPAPTTTIPSTPPATIPPAPTTTAPAPPPATPVAAARGIIPPAEPPANIAPDPDFLQSCSGSAYDDSAGCTGATLAAIANGRSREGLPPMTLPSNWARLTPQQQLFVVTDLERTARGLPPLTALVSTLDQAASQGASQDDDPTPPAGFPYTEWGSNWAGAVGNPLEAMYLWMYDDGLGSANVDCTSTNQSGCWGHRQNVLLGLPCRLCVMGTGWLSGGYSGDPSMAELLVESSGSPAVDFTWQQESAYLP